MKGLALLLLGLSLQPPDPSNDLAALARKEKERRAKVAKPTKVLTEDDTKDASARGAGSVTTLGGDQAASAPAAPAAQSGAAKAPDDPSLVWKQQAAAARQAIADAQARLAMVEREIIAVRSDLAPLSAAEAQDPLRLQKKEAKIFELNKEIEVSKALVEDARKALVELEERARKQHVPPGWLR